jgi:integrase
MKETFLESLATKATRKSYSHGLKKFEEFYGKDAKFLLKGKDPGKVIERFYVWVRKKYSQNSCRALVNPIIQYCKYNDVEPRIRKSLGIYTTVLTTRDHRLVVDEARAMYEVGSLEEKVMVKTWLLGLRISDACRLQWQAFDYDQVSTEPREVLVNTRKEGIVAHCFVDSEFQGLLKKYIVNLDQDNPYLFQSNEGEHLKTRQMLRNLQSLQRRAGIKAHGRFGWHIGRKLFLRTCAENGVVSWNAKLLTGKAVDKSIATYIDGVALKKDAEKVLNVLKMEPTKGNGRITNLQTAMDLLFNVMRKMVEKELVQTSPVGGLMGFQMDRSQLSDEEVLRAYLET